MASAVRRLVALVAVAAAAASVAAEAASPRAAATRVVDRTYTCTLVSVGGGVFDLEARAHSGTRARGAWARLPFAAIATGQAASIFTLLDDSLAWITAGRPHALTTLEDGGRAAIRATEYGTLALNTRRCKLTRARVPLTARGLDGGVAGPLGEEMDCEAPRRVLLRVRARSATPIALRRDGPFLKARATFKEAYVAVRTLRGKPLAFASVGDSGKTRLFTATPSLCFAD